MGLMSGKTVVIFGIANKRSIAWGIAQALHREGARLALTYQNDRMEDPVRKLAAELPGDTFLAPCDVTVAGDIDRFYERLGKEVGAKPSPAVSAIDGQAADHRHRNGFRGVAPHPAGRGRTRDRAGGNGEEGDDPRAFADHVGPREAAFVLEGALSEPVVQCGGAAIE